MAKGIHYYSVDEIQEAPWVIQGSYYATVEAAKFAAMKLYCSTTGVIVKRSTLGFALLFWRRSNPAA